MLWGTQQVLSNATMYDLWRISVENDSNQDWLEWSGQAGNNNATTSYQSLVPTVGSVLILNPAKDFRLTASETASSIGQFQFTITVNYTNQTASTVTYPELCIAYENCGVFVNNGQGQSASYVNVLT